MDLTSSGVKSSAIPYSSCLAIKNTERLIKKVMRSKHHNYTFELQNVKLTMASSHTVINTTMLGYS